MYASKRAGVPPLFREQLTVEQSNDVTVSCSQLSHAETIR